MWNAQSFQFRCRTLDYTRGNSIEHGGSHSFGDRGHLRSVVSHLYALGRLVHRRFILVSFSCIASASRLQWHPPSSWLVFIFEGTVNSNAFDAISGVLGRTSMTQGLHFEYAPKYDRRRSYVSTSAWSLMFCLLMNKAEKNLLSFSSHSSCGIKRVGGGKAQFVRDFKAPSSNLTCTPFVVSFSLSFSASRRSEIILLGGRKLFKK